MSPSDIRLVETCSACPEQYDAYVGDRQVGYLRLRHGTFLVHVLDAGGEVVYVARPKGDGTFDEDERDFYLTAAKDAIAKSWMEEVGDESRRPHKRKAR